MPVRFWLFLYSGRNIAGSVLALAGLGLFFAGVIERWWPLIVAGMYTAGWLAVPSNPELTQQVRSETAQASLADCVGKLLAENAGSLPPEALQRLRRTSEMVDALAPRLFAGDVAMDYAIALTNSVTRDLPQTLQSYRRLPAAFASMHAVDNGKTCRQLLVEQLDLLNGQVATIAANVAREDADALVANGKFLREKFQPLSFPG